MFIDPGTEVYEGMITVAVHDERGELWRMEPGHNTGYWRDSGFHPEAPWLDFACPHKSGTALGQPASFWSRAAFDKAGGLNESLHYVMDYELYVRLARSGFLPLCVKIPFARYRKNDQTKTTMAQLPLFREHLRLAQQWSETLTGADRNSMTAYTRWIQQKMVELRLRSVIRSIPGLRRIEKAFPFSSEPVLLRFRRGLARHLPGGDRASGKRLK